MGVKYEDIIKRLEALGYPIAEYEFRATKKNPAPAPPFIIYFRVVSSDGPDGMNRLERSAVSVELYTDRAPDHGIERRIETEVLNDVVYNKFQAEIESENMYQTAYEFNVVEKIKS